MLKTVKTEQRKALFTVGAQIYIAQAGGAVPQVYLNREGNPVTEIWSKFLFYEWIEGRDFSFARPADLRLPWKVWQISCIFQDILRRKAQKYLQSSAGGPINMNP